MPPSRLLIDTGPIVALLSADDQYHSLTVQTLRDLPTPLYTCWPVITEAAWLLRNTPAGVDRLLSSFNAGLLQLLPLDESAAPTLSRLLTRYHKLRPQLADLCLLHLADRQQIRTLFTFDRRDFSVYRTPTNKRLKLIPDL